MPLQAVICAVAGFLIGPLVGIAVDRAVEREGVRAVLRCPDCRAELGAMAFLPLSGASRRCPDGHSIRRYTITTVATALSFAIAGYRFGFSWQLGPYLALFAALVAMSVIDLETKLLVDILTYPTLAAFAFAVLTLSPPNDYADGIVPALWAGGLYFAFYLVVHVAYPAGMGFGDVKLAPTLGLAVGWLYTDTFMAIQRMLVAVILGLLLGGVIGVIGQRSRKAEIPFGPFMVIGTLIVIAITPPASIQ